MVLSFAVYGVFFSEVHSSVGSATVFYYVINLEGFASWRPPLSCMASSSWRDQAPLVGDQAS